jgi:tetratricopeptide (TPR) repeat protein
MLGSGGLSVVTAVQGIGGVGKTQLAARFFRDHQGEFDFAAWVDMRERDGLPDLEAIADGLGLSTEAIDVGAAVTSHVKGSTASWLMVFDNAEGPGQVESLVVQAPNVTTVITSRHRSWQRFGPVLRVEVFDRATALGFLEDRSGRSGDPDAERLAEALGFLPLALALASAYVRERSITFAAYLDEVLPVGLIEALTPDDPTSYDRAVDALWEESLQAVANQDAGCRDLIQLLSVIDWTSIDRGWLTARLGDKSKLGRRLGLLSSYSLLRLTDTTVAVAHNLIADGVAAQAGTKCRELVTRLFEGALSPASADQRVAAAAAEPIRHLQRLLTDHPHNAASELTSTILRAANQLNEQGSVSQELHHQATKHCDHHHGTEHPDTLRARASLAVSYWQAGRNDEAITIEEEVLADRERILGGEHPDTLTARANLAASYSQAGRNDEAITFYEEVLADRERILGGEHPDTLRARANLAASYWQAGRNDEAITNDEDFMANSESVC